MAIGIKLTEVQSDNSMLRVEEKFIEFEYQKLPTQVFEDDPFYEEEKVIHVKCISLFTLIDESDQV